MKENPIYKEELEKVFRYNVESNVLERELKSGVCRVVKIDKANTRDGYVQVKFNGRNILAHRLIYTIVNGKIPDNKHIDHIDEVKTNNHIKNLQTLTNRDNLAKSKYGLSPRFRKDINSYRVEEKVKFGKKNQSFHFKYFKIKSEAKDFCNAYNAQFGYGKPLYKSRLSTPEYWRSCMQTFKDSYFNIQKEYA